MREAESQKRGLSCLLVASWVKEKSPHKLTRRLAAITFMELCFCIYHISALQVYRLIMSLFADAYLEAFMQTGLLLGIKLLVINCIWELKSALKCTLNGETEHVKNERNIR